MPSIQDLWDRLHLAQSERNVDAALCFRHAIEAYNRCDHLGVAFWCEQAERCEATAA